MTSPIKYGIRHDMPADNAEVDAKKQLNNLVGFINNVKDTARLRAKTDNSDPTKVTTFLHTRTGTIFGRLYKFITSNGKDAEIQRNLAKVSIEKVVNNVLKDVSDDTAKNIAKRIKEILDKPNREFTINLTDEINLFSSKEKEIDICKLKENLNQLNDYLANKNTNNLNEIDSNKKNYIIEHSEEYSFSSNETDSDGNDANNRTKPQVRLGNQNISDNFKSTYKIPRNISRSVSIKLINSGFNENNSKSEELKSNLLSKEELDGFNSSKEDPTKSYSDIENSENTEIQNSPGKNTSQEIDEKEDEQPDFVSLTLLSNEINLIDEESKNESPNILNSSIEISEKVKFPNLKNENISQEIIQKKDGQLELVSVEELSIGSHGFFKIVEKLSIFSAKKLPQIHADVYLLPKNFQLSFAKESLIPASNTKAEKFTINHGSQEFTDGKRQYIKLQMDSFLIPQDTLASSLDIKSEKEYENGLVELYKTSIDAVMSLPIRSGQKQIESLAISPILSRSLIASDAEIRALKTALKAIQETHPNLNICIVTTAPLKKKIQDAMN